MGDNKHSDEKHSRQMQPSIYTPTDAEKFYAAAALRGFPPSRLASYTGLLEYIPNPATNLHRYFTTQTGSAAQDESDCEIYQADTAHFSTQRQECVLSGVCEDTAVGPPFDAG